MSAAAPPTPHEPMAAARSAERVGLVVVDKPAGVARAMALTLTGEIEQVPPMVSALKHRGERLYRLARRGTEVERAPRRLVVHSWEWLGFEGPAARFRVVCSGGTYVRTLAHD